MVRYNTVLDTTRIRVGPQMAIKTPFSILPMHFNLDLRQIGLDS